MNTSLSTLSNSLSTNMIADHELIVLTAKQTRQIQIIREAANTGDLLDVTTSKDKALASIMLGQIAGSKMRELLHTYTTTGNASGLVRWVNLQIGTLNIPPMPAKRIELANYEATLASWVTLNNKGEPNTEKSANARRAAIRWMTPILKTIREMNTVRETPESLQG